MNYQDRMSDNKRKCPKCGSMALYIPVSIMAKIKYNGNRKLIYGVDKTNTDNIFCNGITCEKCGWFGSESELSRC